MSNTAMQSKSNFEFPKKRTTEENLESKSEEVMPGPSKPKVAGKKSEKTAGKSKTTNKKLSKAKRTALARKMVDEPVTEGNANENGNVNASNPASIVIPISLPSTSLKIPRKIRRSKKLAFQMVFERAVEELPTTSSSGAVKKKYPIFCFEAKSLESENTPSTSKSVFNAAAKSPETVEEVEEEEGEGEGEAPSPLVTSTSSSGTSDIIFNADDAATLTADEQMKKFQCTFGDFTDFEKELSASKSSSDEQFVSITIDKERFKAMFKDSMEQYKKFQYEMNHKSIGIQCRLDEETQVADPGAEDVYCDFESLHQFIVPNASFISRLKAQIIFIKTTAINDKKREMLNKILEILLNNKSTKINTEYDDNTEMFQFFLLHGYNIEANLFYKNQECKRQIAIIASNPPERNPIAILEKYELEIMDKKKTPDTPIENNGKKLIWTDLKNIIFTSRAPPITAKKSKPVQVGGNSENQSERNPAHERRRRRGKRTTRRNHAKVEEIVEEITSYEQLEESIIQEYEQLLKEELDATKVVETRAQQRKSKRNKKQMQAQFLDNSKLD